MKPSRVNRVCRFALVSAALVALSPGAARAMSQPTLAGAVGLVQPKMVKIYGAGGLRGLEAYQTGFLFTDHGHVLTVWSYVLDSDVVNVTLHDGRKFEATLVGADPRLEIAVLKIDATDLPHFDLRQSPQVESATRVLAFCNLFGVATGNEPMSVLHGFVAAKTSLTGRSGTFETPYRGSVYVLDAITNNPGAGGGALTNHRGELIGLLGKELRNSLNNTWLNYAIPIEELAGPVDDILAGKTLSRETDKRRKAEPALKLADLGIVLVPDVLERTPPFVDLVRRDSPAAAAGVRPDDLIIFLNDQLIQSCKRLEDEVGYFEPNASIKLTVMRDQQLIDLTLKAAAPQE